MEPLEVTIKFQLFLNSAAPEQTPHGNLTKPWRPTKRVRTPLTKTDKGNDSSRWLGWHVYDLLFGPELVKCVSVLFPSRFEHPFRWQRVTRGGGIIIPRNGTLISYYLQESRKTTGWLPCWIPIISCFFFQNTLQDYPLARVWWCKGRDMSRHQDIITVRVTRGVVAEDSVWGAPDNDVYSF